LKPIEQDDTDDHHCNDDEVWSDTDGKCIPKPTEQVAQEEPCPEGEVWDPRAGKCVTPTTQETIPDLDAERTSTQRVSPDVTQGVYPSLGTVSHTDPKTPVGDSPGTIVVFPKEKAEPDMVTHDTEPKVDVRDRPMPQVEIPEPTSKDTKMPPEHIGVTDAGTSPVAPESPTTLPTPTPVPTAPLDQAGKELGQPGGPHDCADGYHWDFDANGCIPDEPITEMVRRVKAEAKLVHNEKGMKAFEQYYIDQLKKERVEGNKLRTHCDVIERHSGKLTRLYDNAVRDLHNEQVKSEQWKRLRDEATGQRDDFKRAYENLRLSYEEVNSKYHATLKTNLELSQKMTTDNEEYLELHKKYEASEEARKRMRNEAKKIIRVTAS